MVLDKIILSPVTRLSGLYKINITVEKGNIIDAASSGTLFRGYESMLIGKDPRDAVYFTQRICGICSTAHSIAASSALEDISKIEITSQAKIIRNIIHGYDFLQNHIRQTYFFVMPDFIKIPQADSITGIDYRVPEPLTERIVQNYIHALEISRLAHQGLSIFGGKAPHNHGVVFGGVSSNIDPYYVGRAINDLDKISSFVDTDMQEDVNTIERYYADYLEIGRTPNNFLSYGLYNEFPKASISTPQFIINNRAGMPNYGDITENSYALYPIQPEDYKYNFIKAARYQGQPMECGPIARAVIRGEKHSSTTLNRIKARAKEASLICSALRYFIGLLDYGRNTPVGLIKDGSGTGAIDTIRGALLHQSSITDGRISDYNIITPSTWNLSPQDSNGIKGPVESAIIGTRIRDINNPIEIVRTIHSFDPCISCATHVYSENGDLLNVLDIMHW